MNTLSSLLNFIGTKIEDYDEKQANITRVETFSIPANSTYSLSVANGEKLIVVGIGGGNSQLLGLVNASATGNVTSLKVASGISTITLTDGINAVGITNTPSYTMSVLVIGFTVSA